METTIRELVYEYIRRGKVDVRIVFRDKRLPEMEIDEERLMAVWNLFEKAKRLVNSEQEIGMDRMMRDFGVMIEKTQQLDEFKNVFEETIRKALQDHKNMAEKEGDKMEEFFVSSLAKISASLSTIENEFPEYKNDLFNKYKTQISDLLQEATDEDSERRILMETAIFIERSDITEEIVRLKDHIEKFRHNIAPNRDLAGKSLNFILQEMHREINTIGSKFNSNKVFSQVLAIKEEIEKCREQVQNVE